MSPTAAQVQQYSLFHQYLNAIQVSSSTSYVSISLGIKRVQKTLGDGQMSILLKDKQREGNQNYLLVSLLLSGTTESPGCFPLMQTHNARQLLPRKPYRLKMQVAESEKNERQREMELLARSHITSQWQTCDQRATSETDLQYSAHFILTCLYSYSFWRLIGHTRNTAK